MKILLGIILMVFLVGTYGDAYAAYPDKPIKVIIGYEAGSSADVVARSLLPLVEKELGQPTMIINKPGAASGLAMRELYDSKPDGYTIGISSSVNVLKIQGVLPYTHHDFDVLAVPSLVWCVLAVSAKTPFKSTGELIEYAKANPGKLRMSTTSKGATYWFFANYFERVAGVKFNIIANPGGATHIATQLGGGHADVGIAGYTALQSQIEAGNIRVLAITAAKRVQGFENHPTLKEQGLDIVFESGNFYVAPKGLPPDIYKKLLSAFSKAISSEKWRDWCAIKASTATPEYVGEAAVKLMDQDAEMQRPILESLKGN